MEDTTFEELLAVITEKTGIHCQEYSHTFIKRRIALLLKKTNTENYASYKEKLLRDPQEAQKIHKEIFINVTNFFRDKSMWDTFKEKIIPEIIKRKEEQKNKNIRIWSAGCSTGDEAYTALICLYELLGKDVDNYTITIIGTDVSQHVIEQAKQGQYNFRAFRETDTEILEKYFTKEGKEYRMKQELKEKTIFFTGDILSMDIPKDLDVLFCRNTLIYFNNTSKESFCKKMYLQISPYCFLIIGKTESISEKIREKYTIINKKEKIFQKQHQA